ncbi:hypothetical protein OOK36_48355 [Streptomyces sp. NBC_00365]|uniref:hypothetical protein n=1 Tax=Streptomyces sp. NBC_00365 TaxID=2975726 RepID=UPI00224CE1DD|nr:hypothetical protein [Streptomyces sp. NBC_00365]MCX5096426.1 hypothetical protein [Streptomyces sp. NBC_00365]
MREWLTWSSVGREEGVFKRLDDAYRPSVRGWQKYKVRETSEAIVGAVTGSPAAPRTLLLGRYDGKAAFSTSAAPPLSPRQWVLRWAGFSLRPARPSLDGLVFLRRVGHQEDVERHAGAT